MTSLVENAEQEIANLLDELTQVQTELLDVLAQKKQRMAQGDFEGLALLQEQESQLGRQLEICQHRRQQLLDRARQEGLPGTSLSELAQVVPSPDPSLRQQLTQVGSRMRLLQHESLAAWVTTQRTLLHLSQLLEIVATRGRFKPTYDKGPHAQSCGALVDREV